MIRSKLIKSAVILSSVAVGLILGTSAASALKRNASSKSAKPWTRSVSFPDMKLDDSKTCVSPTPGVLIVKAQANINNGPRPEELQWFLLVRHPDTNHVFSEGIYDHQIFTVKPGAEVHPTFAEKLPFLPGRYKVTVGLMRLHPLVTPEGDVLFPKGQTTCSDTFYEEVR
ncbi:MAG: hypothetical protein ACYC61_01895 [Isosphaeraceae bacterium]